jgi:hypothetical protein
VQRHRTPGAQRASLAVQKKAAARRCRSQCGCTGHLGMGHAQLREDTARSKRQPLLRSRSSTTHQAGLQLAGALPCRLHAQHARSCRAPACRARPAGSTLLRYTQLSLVDGELHAKSRLEQCSLSRGWRSRQLLRFACSGFIAFSWPTVRRQLGSARASRFGASRVPISSGPSRFKYAADAHGRQAVVPESRAQRRADHRPIRATLLSSTLNTIHQDSCAPWD